MVIPVIFRLKTEATMFQATVIELVASNFRWKIVQTARTSASE